MKRLFLFLLTVFAAHIAHAQVVQESIVAGFPTQIETPRLPGGYQEIGRINVGVLPESVAFSPDATLLSVVNPTEVNFYAIDGKKLGSIALKAGTTIPAYSSIAAASFAPDNSRFYTLKNGTLSIWNTKVNDKSVEVSPLWNRENIASAHFSLDSTSILYCEKKKNTFFLTLVSIEDQKVFWSQEIGRAPAIQIVAPPDGSFAGVVCAAPDRKYESSSFGSKHFPVTVARWNPNTGETLSSIGISDYYPYEIKLSRNAKILMYSMRFDTKVVDAETGSRIFLIGEPFRPSALSGDGQIIFHQDMLCRVFDSPYYYANLHHRVISATDFSMDGMLWCATAEEDSTKFLTGKSRYAIQIWQHVS